MSIAEVAGQKSSSPIRDSSVASSSLAFPNNVTQNSLVTLSGAVWNSSAVTSVTVTKSAGSASISAISSVVAYRNVGVNNWLTFFSFAIVAPGGGGSLTLSVAPNTASGNYINGQCDEFSGTARVSPLDVDGGSVQGSVIGGIGVTDSITTGTDNALIIGILSLVSAPGVQNTGVGYTLLDEDESNDREPYTSQWKIAGAAGAYDVDFTWQNVDRDYLVQNLSFKEFVATATPKPQTVYMRSPAGFM